MIRKLTEECLKWGLKINYVVHGAMGYGQINFMLVWRCLQLQSGFLAMPRVSRLSASDNKVKPISWYLP